MLKLKSFVKAYKWNAFSVALEATILPLLLWLFGMEWDTITIVVSALLGREVTSLVLTRWEVKKQVLASIKFGYHMGRLRHRQAVTRMEGQFDMEGNSRLLPLSVRFDSVDFDAPTKKSPLMLVVNGDSCRVVANNEKEKV